VLDFFAPLQVLLSVEAWGGKSAAPRRRRSPSDP
jgi:hypothetical protein